MESVNSKNYPTKISSTGNTNPSPSSSDDPGLLSWHTVGTIWDNVKANIIGGDLTTDNETVHILNSAFDMKNNNSIVYLTRTPTHDHELEHFNVSMAGYNDTLIITGKHNTNLKTNINITGKKANVIYKELGDFTASGNGDYPTISNYGEGEGKGYLSGLKPQYNNYGLGSCGPA